MARILTSTVSPSMSPSPGIAHGTQSEWRSPVPFLFGGLGAMLILITFALLILACSYLKLYGYLESVDGGTEEQGGEGKARENVSKPTIGFVEQFVVIMAGDDKPMFLATPIPKPAVASDSRTVDSNRDDKVSSNCEAGGSGGTESVEQNWLAH